MGCASSDCSFHVCCRGIHLLAGCNTRPCACQMSGRVLDLSHLPPTQCAKSVCCPPQVAHCSSPIWRTSQRLSWHVLSCEHCAAFPIGSYQVNLAASQAPRERSPLVRQPSGCNFHQSSGSKPQPVVPERGAMHTPCTVRWLSQLCHVSFLSRCQVRSPAAQPASSQMCVSRSR